MLVPSTVSPHLCIIKLPDFQQIILQRNVFAGNSRKPTRRLAVSSSPQNRYVRGFGLETESVYSRSVLTRVFGDGDGAIDASQKDFKTLGAEETSRNPSSSNVGDSYVALFVRMLGLDNDPLDREQAIVALWKHSLGGKKCVDAIMQFTGCLNLTVNLLKSDSTAACEAAAGLLRSTSSINSYRESVAESGAVEEIIALLDQPSLTSDVKEQCICTLWNLSVDEKLRAKIADVDTLRLIIRSLDDEDVKVKEAAGGVLANLALSRSNHKIMIEAGVIPRLAKLLKGDAAGSKVVKNEARNVLLELLKDEYHKILIIEEGIVPVPLIGVAAYKSFKPGLYSWPNLPDGTEIEQTSKSPSRFGAAELLLGLNVDKSVDLNEIKEKSIIGRAQQQFLARIGAIELENGTQSDSPHGSQQLTLLRWMDGVARLVLILGLEDETAVSRAADSIADASINEHMRISFKEAGAIKLLVQLLDHGSENVKLSALRALMKLSISHSVCQTIEAEGIITPLVNILKHSEMSGSLTEQALSLLAHILDPSKKLKSKFYEAPVNGSKTNLDAATNPDISEASKTDSRIDGKELLDTGVITRLFQLTKTASSDLQRKLISILEFIVIIDPTASKIIAEDMASVLDAVFQQKILEDVESDEAADEPEKYALELEEAGLTISAASRLLTRLLDSESFRQTLKNPSRFTNPLRRTLKSNISLHHKDWVAACLVKLGSLTSQNQNLENPITMEVALFETIPRLINQIDSSFSSPESKEAAVIELNRIISEGIVESTRAVASHGGIQPLVNLIEDGTERAVEASLTVLYNLSMDAENHAAIIRAGAVPALRKIVLSHRPPWMRALRLLRNLPV